MEADFFISFIHLVLAFQIMVGFFLSFHQHDGFPVGVAAIIVVVVIESIDQPHLHTSPHHRIDASIEYGGSNKSDL